MKEEDRYWGLYSHREDGWMHKGSGEPYFFPSSLLAQVFLINQLRMSGTDYAKQWKVTEFTAEAVGRRPWWASDRYEEIGINAEPINFIRGDQ